MKKAKKKPAKRKKSRLPVSVAEVTRLGLECQSLTAAGAEIRTAAGKRPRRSLREYFKKYAPLKEAWRRGRFLRDLGGLARTVVTVSEAARKLKLASGKELREILDGDDEAADIWEQNRLDVFIETKSAFVELAREGNQAAIKAVEWLLREQAPGTGGGDFKRVTTAELVAITARTRQTVHDWVTKFALPRNADKTFDLTEFVAWFERFVLVKAGKESRPATMNPFQARKAELMDIEIDRQKARLLDRQEVLAGIAARYERLVHARRKIDELAAECAGLDRERIADICGRFFDEIISFQKQDFEELRLPEPALEKFCECLAIIRKD